MRRGWLVWSLYLSSKLVFLFLSLGGTLVLFWCSLCASLLFLISCSAWNGTLSPPSCGEIGLQLRIMFLSSSSFSLSTCGTALQWNGRSTMIILSHLSVFLVRSCLSPFSSRNLKILALQSDDNLSSISYPLSFSYLALLSLSLSLSLSLYIYIYI